MKVFSTIMAVIIVGLSIPVVYHTINMYITGNHPNNFEFYLVSIYALLTPVLAVWMAIDSYKTKKKKADLD